MEVAKEMFAFADTEADKQNMLRMLDEVYQDVQQGTSKGFVLAKVVSTDEDGFTSSSIVYNISIAMFCELIYVLLRKTEALDVFRMTLFSETIDAIKERVSFLDTKDGGDAPKN